MNHANGHTTAIITSLLRRNDVATSFRRNNDVIIASCVRWDAECDSVTPTPLSTLVAVTVSKMAATQSDRLGRQGSFDRQSPDLRLKTFLYMTIICLEKGMPSMVIIRATIKELYDGKHAKRENSS